MPSKSTIWPWWSTIQRCHLHAVPIRIQECCHVWTQRSCCSNLFLKGLVGGHRCRSSSAQCWGVLHPWKSGARAFCDAFDDDIGFMMMMTWAKQWLWWEWWCCCCQVKTTERLVFPSGSFNPTPASELSTVENQSKENLTTGKVVFSCLLYVLCPYFSISSELVAVSKGAEPCQGGRRWDREH